MSIEAEAEALSSPARTRGPQRLAALALLAALCWLAWGRAGEGGELLYEGPGQAAAAQAPWAGLLETPPVPLEPLDTLRLSVTAPGNLGYAVLWSLPDMGALKADQFPPPVSGPGPLTRSFLLDCQLCAGTAAARVLLPRPDAGITLRLERQTRLSLLAEACRIVFPVLAGLVLAAFFSPRRFLAPVLVCLACFVFYALVASAPSGTQSGDNRWYLPTAVALLDGGAALNGYGTRLGEIQAQSVRRMADGRVVNYYPAGLSLALVPVAAWSRGLGAPESLVAEASAELIAALSVGLFFAACLRLGMGRTFAGLAAVAFASCSSQLSVHAGALASHNLACLISLAMILPLLGPGRRHAAALALLGVFGVMVRHDMAFMLLGAAMSLALVSREDLWRFLGWCAAFAPALLALNYWIYGSPLPPYVLEQAPGGGLAQAPAALSGLLFSPNRGLLFYNPLFLPGVCYVLWRVWRPSQGPAAGWGVSLAFAAFCGALAMFPMWWGGWSYGPRLFGSMYGVLAVLSVLGVQEFLRRRSRTLAARRWLAVLALAPLLCWGAWVHVKGAVVGDSWNGDPVDVNTHTGRLWDWRDMQILRDADVLREMLRRSLHGA